MKFIPPFFGTPTSAACAPCGAWGCGLAGGPAGGAVTASAAGAAKRWRPPAASSCAVNILSVTLTILLCVAVAGRFLDRRPFRDFGLHFSRGWWADFGFGLALGAA